MASFNLNQIMGRYNSAYNQASNANESRYNDILNQYRQEQQRIMGLLGQQGASDTQRINQHFTGLATGQQQDLVSRGLGNSTIAPTVAAGTERLRQEALSSAQDQRTQLMAGWDQRLTDAMLGFMERRTDSYPDTSQMAQLMQQYGAAGGMGNQASARHSSGIGNTSVFAGGGGISGQQAYIDRMRQRGTTTRTPTVSTNWGLATNQGTSQPGSTRSAVNTALNSFFNF